MAPPDRYTRCPLRCGESCSPVTDKPLFISACPGEAVTGLGDSLQTGLVVLYSGGIGNDLHQLHHAAVFVAQNVAMQHVHAGEIHKPGQHLHAA